MTLAVPSDSLAPAPPLLDLAHLERVTFGSAYVEREVLALFLDQARETVGALVRGAAGAVAAHRLKGAARGVGAEALALLAEAAEAGAVDPARLTAVAAATEAAVNRRLAALAVPGRA